MPKAYKNEKSYRNSWYALTANRLLMTLGTLKGEINCDVCIVGGGFTGISAALELAQKGFSVVLLEKDGLAASASGRNGGQLIRGYYKSPAELSAMYGTDNAKLMCNATLEGLALILSRITQHEIKCDLKFGHLTAALGKRQAAELQRYRDAWEKIGHTDMEYVPRSRARELVRSDRYVGGLFDPKGAHLHPVNYALGIAQAAQKAGCKIYDDTRVLRVETGAAPEVVTENGRVRAKFVILAGAIDLQGAAALRRVSLQAAAHVIVTEPLGAERAGQLIPADIAVADANSIMDYYRLTADRRLLFGGNCNYGGHESGGEDKALRARLLRVFPQIRSVRIDHCWRGPLDITLNRLPHVGRLSPTVFFAHGFGGHGLLATNAIGRILAEAVAGTAGRFDVFTKIKHLSLPGGDLIRLPAFMAGVLWYRIRDLLP